MRKLISLNPTVQCIAVGSFLGGPHPHLADDSPLGRAGLVARLRANGLGAEWQALALAGQDDLAAILERLASRCAEVVSRADRPLVLGGDHSLAAATWKGVGRALGTAPGLIWIDAHLDAHTPASSPSGNAHGMPLAALLGEGEAPLATIPGPLLDPSRVVVIGARSFESAEMERLTRLGVRIHCMAEVRERGFTSVFAAARHELGPGPWGISLDVDAVDPGAAPGVATPVPHGITAEELLAGLAGVLRERSCVGLEIVEFDPALDPQGATARFILALAEAVSRPDAATLRRWEEGFGARNYAPLPVVLARGQGAWLEDVEGRRYLDFMSAYSATSFGHAHPRLLAALTEQAGRLAVTSRAYFNDRLPRFLRRLTLLTGYERALPMNTGVEAVETALKAARKWAYEVKGVPPDRAEIIACEGNFHGRTLAAVGLSSEPQYRRGFGPFSPGMKRIPYGDPAALAAAITPHTAAFLVEPIQGEGGIVVPPPGYLAACAALCRRHEVLLIADEVQTGLGRTGRLLACQHDGVRPDGLILGKALGGGLLPVSAFLADEAVMGVFRPGDHGSTFGGNPLAAAVALAALDVLEDEDLVARSAALGEILMERLNALAAECSAIVAVRGRGLFAGLELDAQRLDARRLALGLLEHGVLSKDTHGTVLRLAPPLTLRRGELDWGLDRLAETVKDLAGRQPQAA